VVKNRLASIGHELRQHAPFTLFGALTGIICMFLFRNAGDRINHTLFQIFHPGHVFLSALVTVSLYKLRSGKTNLLLLAVVGYVGSIGVATLSDCIVPYFGDTILGVVVPAHSQLHGGHEHSDEDSVVAEPEHTHTGVDEHAHDSTHVHEHGDMPPAEASHEHEHAHEHVELHADHDHAAEHDAGADVHDDNHAHGGHDCSEHGGLHLGFIEDWYLVNPAALLGILLAFWIPHEKLHTKLPHAGHVLISTWASSFFVLMNTQLEMGAVFFLGMFLVLFIAVWLPCCISDIIFPILLVGPGRVPHCCPLHKPKTVDRE